MNKSLIDIFFQLVKIDSPTGNEQQVANFILDYLKQFADTLKKDKKGNIYARIDGVGEPIFFASHMDTVEPGRGIKPQIKKGYITSDGKTILGADNKMAIACILELAHYLKRTKTTTHRPIEFLFTYSEEVGNYGAINFDYSWLKSKSGYCFDSICPVGTIIQASPFYERFDIKVEGKAAHASLPHIANNTLYFLSSFLKEIKLGKLDNDSILNVGIVQGGDVRNTIPGELIIKGEIRSFMESALLLHKKNAISIIHKLIKKHKMKIEHEFVRENPGYKHIDDKSLAMIKQIKKHMLRLGMNPEIQNAWGVSDANIFNEKGLLCINLGDGVEGAHTKLERIKVNDLEATLQLMVEISRN